MALCSSIRSLSPNTRRASYLRTPNRQRSEQIRTYEQGILDQALSPSSFHLENTAAFAFAHSIRVQIITPAGGSGDGPLEARNMPSMQPQRCSWVNVDHELMRDYHDREWGVPTHDDCTHFEFL